MTDLPTQARYSFGILTFFDPTSGEIMDQMAPITFYDDFLGAGHTAIPSVATAGAYWGSKIVNTAGTVTVDAVANGANGQVALVTDATNEAQEAVLYCLDERAFNAAAALVYETRIQCGAIPTGGTQAVVGMATAWVAAQAETAYLRFALNGNGHLLAQCYDGTNTFSVDTGIVVATTTEWRLLRIDASDPTNVLFYVDGDWVCRSTIFTFGATGTAAQMQPFASVAKASGTSVGTLNIDFISIASGR
jgi:hypothetical protein